MTKLPVALVVMARNPLLGKAKTRIAEAVGDRQALKIYEQLVTDNQDLCDSQPFPFIVYYSHFIDPLDRWCAAYSKALQVPEPDLGLRIYDAISTQLEFFEKIILIGTDCPYITPEILNIAAEKLEKVDVVIGPSTDGGFYLLGLKEMNERLFDKIMWSTEMVVERLRSNIDATHLEFFELIELTDIDYYNDWLEYRSL